MLYAAIPSISACIQHSLMLFGESQFTKPKKTGLQNLKWQLLPLVLLAAIGALILTVGKLPWGAPSDSAPVHVGELGGSAGLPELELMAPMEPQDPAPFEEKPEVLFRAASLDRTSELSEEAIAYLFQKIRTAPAAFRAEEPVLSLARKDAVWSKLIADPAMYRGRVVELKGYVWSSEPGTYPLRLEGMDLPNPSGLDRRFDSFFVDTAGKIYRVTTFKKARELRHRDAVKLRAYFCGLYTNQIEHRGKLAEGTVPFLVGEDFEPIVRPATGGADATVYLPLVLALPVLAFVVMFVLHLRTKKTYEGRRRAAREALHERRAKKLSGGGPIGEKK